MVASARGRLCSSPSSQIVSVAAEDLSSSAYDVVVKPYCHRNVVAPAGTTPSNLTVTPSTLNGSTGAVRELFSRCAKSLVLSGTVQPTEGDHALGFTLELVAEKNPYTTTAGQELPVRLTYEGRPLADGLVVAINRNNPTEKLSARSDANGRVHFRLPQGGQWLIKAVHMIPAKADALADWESFWATLTFEIR